MYESPITKYMGDMQYEIQKQTEKELMVAVNQSIGFDVDKQELIKALQYDREQYSKGYSDCKSDMLDKVKQAREEIQKCVDVLSDDTLASLSMKSGLGLALEKIDKLIESEE